MLSRHVRPIPRFAGRAGLALAVLVAAASLGNLALSDAYARETASWRIQGTAQDWVDLLVAAPWLAVAAILTLRGSRRGALLLGGALAYTAYSFVIYALAMHFNRLFLVYVATLGLSLYALADLARAFAGEPVRTWFDDRAPRRLAGGAMIAFGVGFGLLWIAQIVPATVDGAPPPELAEVGLITNPVHVLDLAIVLPLLILGGRQLWRDRDAGYLLGAILLGFSVIMDLAIMAMQIALERAGLAESSPLPYVFAAATLGFGGLLVRLLGALRAR